MTIARQPTWVDTLTYASLDVRLADQLLAQSDGTAGGSQPGIRPGDIGLAVSLSSTTITVAAGVALIYRAGQGVYRASNPTAWTGTLAAADPTNPRIDLVYLRVWDNSVDGAGLAKADVVYLTGVPAVTPVQPAPGATEINVPLAKITVPASGGGAASVTDLRPCYVAPGGIGVGTGIAGTYGGQYRDTGGPAGTMQHFNGTVWEDILRLAAGGQVNVGGSSSPASLAATLAAATSYLLTGGVSGDTSDRFAIRADGTMGWGPGNAARDTSLYRSAAGTLKTDGTFVAGNLTATQNYTPTIGGGSITLGNGTVSGSYVRMGSATCVNIKITAGTTTTMAATGSLSFTLPPGITHNGTNTVGSGYFTTTSGGAFNLAACTVNPGSSTMSVFVVGSNNTYQTFNTGGGAGVANGSVINVSIFVQS